MWNFSCVTASCFLLDPGKGKAAVKLVKIGIKLGKKIPWRKIRWASRRRINWGRRRRAIRWGRSRRSIRWGRRRRSWGRRRRGWGKK